MNNTLVDIHSMSSTKVSEETQMRLPVMSFLEEFLDLVFDEKQAMLLEAA